jgi:transposase
MSELKLTAAQRRRLQAQLRRTRDTRVYRRTLAVLEVARGRPIRQVAEELEVTRQSVYNWVEVYSQAHDPAALLEGQRPGRPSLWTEGCQEALRGLLGQSPQRLGYPAVNWAVPLLQEQLQRCTGQRLSEDTIRRELHRLDYRCKRPRYALDPDPEVEKKTPDSQAHQGPGAAGRPAG